ncbi:hydroxycarboxylic acid receptor 3-like [Latimeria chalumnae]|uniref:hydroxycarboxylic acid receptor 3-like n=1 Tax=Latimeria chalumnae TaxID=7897 RepID=UPI0003C15AA3
MNNQTSCCVFDGELLSYILPPFLILEFVFGLVANGIALWIFCFNMKRWKASTLYLFNLALADFLLIFCLPFRTDYYLKKKNWTHGDAFCSLVLFMLALNRAGSIVFLTAVATDRYFRVVHPHHRINAISVKSAAILAGVLWTLTIGMTAYLLTDSHLFPYQNLTQCDSFTICTSASSAVWHNLLFLAEFTIALCIILYCTYQIIMQLRQRQMDKQEKVKKTVKLVSIVAVVFIVSFLPSVLARVHIWILKGNSVDCTLLRSVDVAFYITICFTYFNSMLDPVVYYFSSSLFKSFYKRVITFSLHRTTNEAAEKIDTSCSQSTSRL